METETETTKPAVDQDELINILDVLSTMIVELDEDPLEYDPKRLNAKIKDCRDHLDKVSTWALTSNKRVHLLKTRRLHAQKLYDIKEIKLFEDDPDIKMGKHMEERKRMARNRLPDLVEELAWLLHGVEDHKTLQDSLKLKRDDLKNTQGQIKEQIKLCNECLGLGMKWGEKARQPLADLTPGLGQDHIQSSIQDARNLVFSPYSEQDRANAVQLGALPEVNNVIDETELQSKLEDLDSLDLDALLSDSDTSDSDKVDVNSLINNLSEESTVHEVDTNNSKEVSKVTGSQLEDSCDVTNLLDDVLEDSTKSVDVQDMIENVTDKIEKDLCKIEEDHIDSVLNSEDMAQAAKPSAVTATSTLSFENLEDIFEI